METLVRQRVRYLLEEGAVREGVNWWLVGLVVLQAVELAVTLTR